MIMTRNFLEDNWAIKNDDFKLRIKFTLILNKTYLINLFYTKVNIFNSDFILKVLTYFTLHNEPFIVGCPLKWKMRHGHWALTIEKWTYFRTSKRKRRKYWSEKMRKSICFVTVQFIVIFITKNFTPFLLLTKNLEGKSQFFLLKLQFKVMECAIANRKKIGQLNGPLKLDNKGFIHKTGQDFLDVKNIFKNILFLVLK